LLPDRARRDRSSARVMGNRRKRRRVAEPLRDRQSRLPECLAGFASLLAWFWLLRRYLAARLGVLSFLTPMLGVLAGVVFLSEPISATFALAALLVGAGIVLVNLRLKP